MKRLVMLLFFSCHSFYGWAQDYIYGLSNCLNEFYCLQPDILADADLPNDPIVEVSDSSFQTFLPQFEKGLQRFINGDPKLWKQQAWQGAEATLMGAWGAYEKDWKQVSQRYDWAAARFVGSGATVQIEYLAQEVSGDLAYTVSIERSRVHIIHQAQPATMVLRVTHLFRRKAGEWKLVHRHADALTEKTAPATVLKK